MREIIIGKNEAGQRLDKLLKKYLKEASTGFLYKMLRKKNITLNHKKAEGKEILSLGDRVCLYFSEETLNKFTGTGESKNRAGILPKERESEYGKACRILKNITIIYEDEDIILLNKPRGVLSQKSAPGDLSLNEWMIGSLLERKQISQEQMETFKPSICNRLDRNTSGLVIGGKSLRGSQLMNQWIKERQTGKFYRCFLKGNVKKELYLRDFIKKDELKNKVEISSFEGEGFSLVETRVIPLLFGKYLGEEITYAEVELITGKTHQIRAHLAGIGHPLLGDEKYGDRTWNEKFFRQGLLKGQMLHSYRVVFPKGSHSYSEKEFLAPLPEYFQKICRVLERG